MREVIIDVTDRCSMQCKYCGTDAELEGNSDIDLGTVAALLHSSINTVSNYKFYFGGGTAFMHKQWMELIRMPGVYGADVVIDCPLDTSVLERLKFMPPDEHGYSPSISLWGVGSIHDELSKPGSYSLFGKFADTIARSSSVIRVSFVLTKELISQQSDIVAFVQNLPYDAEVYFHRLMPVGRARELPLPLRAEIDHFRIAFNDVTAKRIRFHHTLQALSCPAGKNRIFVDHDGLVYSCGWVGSNLPFANLIANNPTTLDELFVLASKQHVECPLDEKLHHEPAEGLVVAGQGHLSGDDFTVEDHEHKI